MKRHPSLHPLSRDHHHALVEARNLILAAVGDPGGTAKAVARFADFWKRDLRDHFSQEEQIVLPLLARWTSADSEVIRQTLTQHAEIEGLVGQLNGRLVGGEPLSAELLDILGEALRRHIRFEEQELFPIIEASVPEAELQQMNRRLTEGRSAGGCAVSLKNPIAKEAAEERP